MKTSNIDEESRPDININPPIDPPFLFKIEIWSPGYSWFWLVGKMEVNLSAKVFQKLKQGSKNKL